MQQSAKLRHLRGLSLSGFHRVAYREWGAADAKRTLVCVHGLTRNGRDFEELAAAAAARGWRVVCPDVVGRGDSEALADPSGYAFPQYLQDMNALLARLDVEEVDWVGTSMGGLMGLFLAALPGTPLRRLMMNDIGPFLPAAALSRLSQQVAEQQFWPDYKSAYADLRAAYAGFGPLTEAQWQRLVERSLIAEGEGWRRNYDPAIGKAFAESLEGDVDLWPFWDQLRLPVLVYRGAQSELLTPETAREMSERGPRAQVVEIAESGHAPALMSDDQIDPILDWLSES